MINQLQILLLIYSVILVINLTTGLMLFKLHRHELFKILIAMWAFSLINFFLQGIFITPGLGMYISFSTYLLVSLCLYQFSNFLLKRIRDSYAIEFTCAAILLLGAFCFRFTNNYSLVSSFAAVAIAIPMLISSYRLWNSKVGPGSNALSILLLFNSIHFLDYPILRFYPSGAIWGFSIALIILIIFSTFFPGFILLQMSNTYTLELEKKVKFRTKDLEEALDQNKTLVNILCHDLSNPLTILDFYLERIFEENDSISHGKYGSNVKQSLKIILTIVAKVKELQAISLGKKNIESKKINLHEAVNEILGNFENSLILKNLSLNFTNLANTDTVILGDIDLLKNQIFTNLISNAIKFSYQDSIIEIIVSENIKHVNIVIEDHGMGIPDELLLKIFKWSEKTNRNGTNGESGTGFGLPLVKTCVEMMGGSIRVESIPKESLDSISGSKFIVQFDKFA
ncbi:MAG: HAMP domain-containing histidine kinase [Bacteriovorax sp.]|nr:HAMP domain-containing histidine kinase [Bacteriovorax sp.]